ncbi:MAG: hypothetical protein KIS61_23280 [Candidatus Eremiobacteraeota bacterium]|nr:hypothetical protein [Candidatus Eremiobacteraeota bacterium]
MRLTGQGASGEVTVKCQEGCELSLPEPILVNGQKSQGLRVVRFRPEAQGVRLLAEGRGGATYHLQVSGRQLSSVETDAVRVEGSEGELRLTLAQGTDYRRLDVLIPYRLHSELLETLGR